MDYEEAVIQMLVTKENLETALEISDILNQWKPRIHRTFWSEMHASLSKRLTLADPHPEWRVQLGNDISKFDQDWFSCAIVPLNLNTGQHFFRVMIQQGRPNQQFLLHYGCVRSHPSRLKDELGIREVSSMIAQLESEGFRNDGSWWPGMEYLQVALMKTDTLLRLASDADREALIEELTDKVWNFFLQHRDLLDSAHQALAARAGV